MYQRTRIQEESLHYESLKHSGKMPIIGVNTFLSSSGSPTILPAEVIRATEAEKRQQIQTVQQLRQCFEQESAVALEALQDTAMSKGNVFEQLMEAAKVCSLGQLTKALFDVGGQYRRNM
jgi:methylmalonyl-CoA mutase